MRKTVDIRQLKLFVMEKLPNDSPLRLILLVEEDTLEISDFLVKLPLWLKLARLSLR
jgi:hypothetical protein